MDELNLALRSRTARSRFSTARPALHRFALFDRAERYRMTASVASGVVSALELAFTPGEQFNLHSLVIRTAEGRDLLRWTGTGALLRGAHDLRFARTAGAVRVECVGEAPALTIQIDPKLSAETLELLLTISSTGAATQPSERTPDRIELALNHLLSRLDDMTGQLDDANGRLQEANRRIDQANRRADAADAEVRRQADAFRTVETRIAEYVHALRVDAEHRQAALTNLINERVGDHLRHQETQLAQAREMIAAQAARAAALEQSTSWRITAPLRLLTGTLTGRQSFSRVIRRLQSRRRPERPPEGGESPISAAGAPLPDEAPPPPQARPLTTVAELQGREPEPLDASVSVVIPAFNAGAEFFWLLRKLQAQKGLRAVEIVVVDSGSSDGTDTMAEQFGCKLVRIKSSEFSHSFSRNKGADNASGDLLVFMTQDAYPVGEWWLHSLASAILRPPEGARPLAAVSCSEYPRTDSEILYNAGVDTHYKFLGCREGDRIGEHIGDDQTSLRAQGQLSDVACMIRADVFQKYRYEGRYAEDLVLGVRLLKDGEGVAMLSSVKVIHSHNRSAAYHLKRTFVDVTFLAEVFEDFRVPMAESATGATLAASALSQLVDGWRPRLGADAAGEVRNLAALLRSASFDGVRAEAMDFGFRPLSPWLNKAMQADDGAPADDAAQVRQMLGDRLENLAGFVEQAYGEVDDYLAEELAAAARKLLAATLGAQLSFLYLRQAAHPSPPRREVIEELRTLMTAGV